MYAQALEGVFIAVCGARLKSLSASTEMVHWPGQSGGECGAASGIVKSFDRSAREK